MMSWSHAFFSHMPNWLGFVLLIVVWMVLRGFLQRSRGSTIRRMQMRRSMPPPSTQRDIRCPRCAASASVVASFCPHCGLSLSSLTPPNPQGQFPQRPARNGMLVLIWILMGVIGLAAYVWWRFGGEVQPTATPEPPHVRIHQYY